jgi:hypothetical protein
MGTTSAHSDSPNKVDTSLMNINNLRGTYDAS